MKISKLNFKHLYPQINKTLIDSNFISMDFEFSGTTMRRELVNTRFDDPHFRYFKLKENIKNFIPLQIGLCGLKVQNSNTVNLFPMNFYIFPYLPDYSDKKLSFDIGSINFLTSNSFDFNKTFYDGIRYISLSEYEKNKQIEDVREIIKSKREKKHFPPEARLLTMTFYPKLKELVDKFYQNNQNSEILNYNHPDNYVEFEVTFIRKILIDYFISNLNSLFKTPDGNSNVMFEVEVEEVNLSKTLIKLKITNEEILDKKSLKLSNEYSHKKIQSWIYYQNLLLNEDYGKLWNKILLNLMYTSLENQSNLQNSNPNTNPAKVEKTEKRIEELKNFIKNENVPEIIKILSGKEINFNSPVLRTLTNSILALDKVDEFFNIGFTKVILDLMQNKKPLILHNGILDLMQLIDKFIEPLPESFEEFRSIVNSSFPQIYDTKYLIENNSSLFSTFQDSSLEFVSKKIMNDCLMESRGINVKVGDDKMMYSSDYKLGIDNTINKEEKLNDNSNDDDSSSLFMKSHEAGYDAMTTSYVFTYIFSHLFKNLTFLANTKQTESCLQIFKNKLLFSGLQVPCDLNINNNNFNTTTNNLNTHTPRFEIFVLSDLPEIISVEEIKNSFNLAFNLTPQVYKLFGQNFAYAIFTSNIQKEKFSNHIKNFQSETTDRRGKGEKIDINENSIKEEQQDILIHLPLQGYNKNSIVLSFEKFTKSLKFSTEENINKIINEISDEQNNQ
jgi:hypothetical protein